MKLRLLFLLLFLGPISAGFAQKRYAEIKRTADYPVDGLTTNMVRLFEGEIYEIIFDDSESSLRNGEKGILLRFGAQSVEVPKNGTKNYVFPIRFSADTFATILSQKGNFIFRSPADEGMYRLNMTGIAPGESIYIASQTVKDILRLETKREADFSAEYFSKHFSNKHLRIIIAGYPSLIYEGNKIGLPADPDPTSDSDRPEGVLLDEGSDSADTESSVGTYLMIFLVILAAGFIFWLNKDKLKSVAGPARNMPKRGFKKTVEKAPQAQPEPEPKIVKITTVPPVKIPEPEAEETAEPTIEESPEPIAEEAPSREEAEEEKEPEMTSRIIDQAEEIPAPENAFADAEINRLAEENRDLQAQLAELQISAKKQSFSEPESAAFVRPESPEDFAECQIGFFELLDAVEAEAEQYYRRTDEVGNAERLVFESVMFRYYRSKSELKTLADWRSLLKELHKTGRISRPSIVRAVQQSGMSDEALFSALQDSVFEEVFKPLAGAALLMTEELRCIEKFTGMSFLLSVQIGERFEELGEEICRYSETVLGKKINYLPLFEVPADELSTQIFTQRAQLQKPGIYDKIAAEPGSVGFVKAYGFDEEPTEIYLMP